MQYTKMTRKQANVLYRNMKDGGITMHDDLVAFMYDRADAHISYNALDDSTEAHLLNAVDAVFAGDLGRAQECIDMAWINHAATRGIHDVVTVTTDDIAAPAVAEATCTSAGIDANEEDEEEEEDGDIENALAYSDGNTGAVIPFATHEEAVREAEIRWAHLTAAERRKYSAPGCYFGVGTVFANGDIDMVLDLTSEEERTLDDWSGTVKVTTTGNSVILKITDAARAMGLERGDFVDVTIRRK